MLVCHHTVTLLLRVVSEVRAASESVCVLLQWDLVILNFTPYELILCGRAAFPCLRLDV